MKKTCTLYLVHHGETEWNKNGTVMGQSDSPLTQKGVAQAKAVANGLRTISFKAIFSSDLSRAKKTAELIRLDRKLNVLTSKKLRERTYGSWEGQKGEDFRKEFQHIFKDLSERSEAEQKELNLANDIESDQEVIDRFSDKLKSIAKAHPNEEVLVVTHGGCIRTFLMDIGYTKYGELPVGSFPNAGYVKLSSDGANFSILEVKK